ncbi:CaiB/baiF CoA-transferase family protein [Ceratobasidium sp. AG-Ba]|nr:CaiB/baiF CoA-transferase family protein [Ceratobasidium sp. AG-Ba]QRW04109.1 CaiB/baiF CoA-transferase family protein [Ceratobasidium sp. AG-Ba]
MPPSTPGGRPSFPLNILADMAGGGLICATGIMAALLLLARSPEARGQVIETDMVAGARYISSFNLIQALIPNNLAFGQPPGHSLLDGGAPFYNSYQCADGGWMSVGCLEPQFYQTFCNLIQNNLGPVFRPPANAIGPNPAKQNDRIQWPAVALWLEAAFRTRPRSEWEGVFKGTDACVVAVLTPAEAARIHGPDPVAHPNFVDPHDTESNSKATIASARTSPPSPSPPTLLPPGTHTFDILRKIGIDEAGIIELQKQGALGRQSEVRSKSKL